VIDELLAPYVAAGSLNVFTRHRPTAVGMDGDRAKFVTLLDERENSERTLTAPIILDATELGDLLELGGVESVVGAESRRDTGEPNALDGPADPLEQNPFTHVFALEHRPGEEHVIDKPRDYEFWRERLNPRTGLSQLWIADLFAKRSDHYGNAVKNPDSYRLSTWNMRRAHCARNFRGANGGDDVSMGVWLQNTFGLAPLTGVSRESRGKAFENARQLSLSLVHWLQTEAPDPETGGQGYPGLKLRGDVLGSEDGIAQFPYIREARRIRAEFTILEQHFFREDGPAREGPVKYPDSVGLSGYRVDIARIGRSGRPLAHENHGKHWRQQIPLGALIPVRVENLLPACKNLGVTALMNGAFRVHVTEWNIGESAGALAAFCVARGLQPREVRNKAMHLADFQAELVRAGIELDWPSPDFARSYFSQISVEHPDWYHGEAWRL